MWEKPSRSSKPSRKDSSTSTVPAMPWAPLGWIGIPSRFLWGVRMIPIGTSEIGSKSIPPEEFDCYSLYTRKEFSRHETATVSGKEAGQEASDGRMKGPPIGKTNIIVSSKWR